MQQSLALFGSLLTLPGSAGYVDRTRCELSLRLVLALYTCSADGCHDPIATVGIVLTSGQALETVNQVDLVYLDKNRHANGGEYITKRFERLSG